MGDPVQRLVRHFSSNMNCSVVYKHFEEIVLECCIGVQVSGIFPQRVLKLLVKRSEVDLVSV